MKCANRSTPLEKWGYLESSIINRNFTFCLLPGVIIYLEKVAKPFQEIFVLLLVQKMVELPCFYLLILLLAVFRRARLLLLHCKFLVFYYGLLYFMKIPQTH